MMDKYKRLQPTLLEHEIIEINKIFNSHKNINNNVGNLKSPNASNYFLTLTVGRLKNFFYLELSL